MARHAHTANSRAASAARATGAGLRLLWIMRSPIFVRNHEAVLRELSRRGHSIHVAFEGLKPGLWNQTTLIDRLTRDDAAITAGAAPSPRGAGAFIRRRARLGIDYLRYLEPAYDDALALRERAARHAPAGIRVLGGLLRRHPAWRAAVGSGLALTARQRHLDDTLASYVRDHRADALLLSPLMHFGSPQPDYVRTARAMGIPTTLVTFSWDNFTNKGLIHEVPDLVTVWNTQQVDEAVFHHSIPRDRVVVTGAPAYDHWFDWRPSRDRRAFCEQLGLDADRPYLLYVCSSQFIAADEPAWIAEWLARLRSAPSPLRDVGVLVRPHPLNSAPWRDRPLAGAEAVTLFPEFGVDPTHTTARADYFDSIYHAAGCVGLNTSALVESAILGRAAFTVRTARYRATQEGTLHFRHLCRENGGPLHVAVDFEQHHAQLAAQLGARVANQAMERFVERFVRPFGLREPAAPRVATAIEDLARRRDRMRTAA